MKYSICAIIKNEQRYLEEWIIHNLNVGFNAIHLYEDYGSESHSNITNRYPQVYLHLYNEVEITNYAERDKKQIDLFNHFVKQFCAEYDWCAFIDPDEYIRFEEGYTLDRLCSEFSDYTGIMIQQKTYGANGHIHRPEGGVQENYTSNPMEYHKPKFNMKTIVNLKEEIQFKGVHRIRGAVFTNYTNRLKQPVCYQKAWYDHYYTKSWEDWIERFTKRGDVCPGNVKVDEFFVYNKNLVICNLNNYLQVSLEPNCRLGNILYKVGVALSHNKNLFLQSTMQKACPDIVHLPVFRNAVWYKNQIQGVPVLDGFCQDYNMLDICVVRNAFKIPKDIENDIITKYQDIRKYVCIHVRRGDFVGLGCYVTPSSEWYVKVYKKYFLNRKAIIISDDVEWCRSQFGEEWLYADSDVLHDFYMQTICYANICSASTFSLMGSILNPNERAIVPSPFYCGKYKDMSESLIPSWAKRVNIYEN